MSAPAKKIAKSVTETQAVVKRTNENLEVSADRRTELAADRTVLAAERTYAAWIRTGLAALASGVGAKTLLSGLLPWAFVQLAGTVLTLFSAFCFGAAVWREFFPEVTRPTPQARRMPSSALFAVNGALAIVSLAALVSLWVRG